MQPEQLREGDKNVYCPINSTTGRHCRCGNMKSTYSISWLELSGFRKKSGVQQFCSRSSESALFASTTLLVGLVQFRLHENVWTENFLTQPPLLVVSRHLFALSFKVKGICFEQPAKKLKSLNFSSFNMQINFATNEQPCPYLDFPHFTSLFTECY